MRSGVSMKILCLLVLLIFIPGYAFAAEYKLIFEENFYRPTKNITDTKSRYLAKVTLYIDGKLVGTKRGSTLADNSVFYQLFELPSSPSGLINMPTRRRDLTDSKITELLKEQENLSRLTQPHKLSPNPCRYSSTRSNSIKMKEPLLDLSKEVLSKQLCGSFWPIIKSGQYEFSVGTHRQKKALNVLGGSEERPFDPKKSKNSKLRARGAISTINNNPNQNNRKLADNINIHWGQGPSWRSNRSYKRGEVVRDDLLFSYRFTGSEGCITIDPGKRDKSGMNDWDKFIELFPDQIDWKKGGHNGILIIRR